MWKYTTLEMDMNKALIDKFKKYAKIGGDTLYPFRYCRGIVPDIYDIWYFGICLLPDVICRYQCRYAHLGE